MKPNNEFIQPFIAMALAMLLMLIVAGWLIYRAMRKR